MGTLDGRVAIVTGAGRGLGREHALLLASEGAAVVVNDVGAGPDGAGASGGAAREVVAQIEAAGGRAVANHDDVADWDGAGRMVRQAVDTFGDLHVLVNNAGILRDTLFVNMSADDWDDIMRVHLRGHFCPSRHAADYWRARSKAGVEVKASIVHTSSGSGLLGNVGQSNYGAAKAGIAAFSNILAMELGRYGVRSNAIAPAARTRLTLLAPGVRDMVAAPEDPSAFDQWDPANVAPVVAYLAEEDCPITGEVFRVLGGSIARFEGWRMGETIERPGRWSVAELREAMPRLAGSAV